MAETNGSARLLLGPISRLRMPSFRIETGLTDVMTWVEWWKCLVTACSTGASVYTSCIVHALILVSICSLLRLELLCQLRHFFKQVADKANICNLEDWRIGVLVDRGNDLAVLHTRQMLNGARDTGAKVELRRNVLASLADLQTVVGETAVDRCS